MKNILAAAILATLAVPAAAQAPAAPPAGGKFGFVHTERILRDSVPAVRAQKKIEAEFQRKQREFREDLNQRRNEELAQVVEQANRIIRVIAEQEKFDIIFQEMPAYVSPRIDITDKVIKALDGKPPAK